MSSPWLNFKVNTSKPLYDDQKIFVNIRMMKQPNRSLPILQFQNVK